MSLVAVLLGVFHSFNKFLGSLGGTLMKTSFELLLFSFVTYMITSDYLKLREKHNRYLIIGFGTLSLTKLISTIIFGLVIFGKLDPFFVYSQFPPFEHFLEVFSLFLICLAFLAPVLNKQVEHLRNKVYIIVGIGLTGFLIIEGMWLYKTAFNPLLRFTSQWEFLLLNMVKIFLLYGASFYILVHYKQFTRTDQYYGLVVQALSVYGITYVISSINFLFFNNINDRLIVLSHPFPFIAVALFARTTFLKLADKLQLVEELEKTTQEYIKTKQISAMKDEFVSIVSHELKTPLTSINLYTSLLMDKQLGDVSEKQIDALKTVKSETVRLSNLINDVLDLSKLENKKVKADIRRCNFYDIVKTCSYSPQAKDKKIEIKNNVPQNLMVKVDEEKMKQVIINLISNAVKFTDERGAIHINATPFQESIEFEVKDNGVGIPEEKIAKLFDKFYQVEDHLTRKAGGTGLGLAIVKGIVELHKGEIEVFSEVGKGTSFVIRLPQKSR